MNENKPEKSINNQKPEEILTSIAAQFKGLTSQCEEVYETGDDLDKYIQFLKKRAQLIVDLPQKIQECVERGELFPKSKMEDLQYMARTAKEALKGGRVFMLGTLLSHLGSQKDTPNDLDILIEEIYPNPDVSL